MGSDFMDMGGPGGFGNGNGTINEYQVFQVGNILLFYIPGAKNHN